MARKPLVSTIIIFLNEEKYIQEAIDSVFAQTYDHWELLLVDDGSTDRSTDIAWRFAQEYPQQVRYLEHDGHENRGMSASRNLGIMNSKGQYIAHLDADDVWLPHKLERQVAILEQYPEAVLVYSPWQAWHSWNERNETKDHFQNLNVQTDCLIQPPKLVPIWLQNDHSIPGHCATMVRRQLYHDVGGFEESFRDIYEDLVLLVKLGLRFPIYVSSECLSRYRQHSDSTCEIFNKEGHMEQARLFYFEWLEEYLEPQKLKYSDVWIALQKVLWSFRHPHLHRTMILVQQAGKRLKRFTIHIACRLLPQDVYQWIRIRFNNQKTWST